MQVGHRPQVESALNQEISSQQPGSRFSDDSSVASGSRGHGSQQLTSKPQLQTMPSHFSLDSSVVGDQRCYGNIGCLNLRSHFSFSSLKPMAAKARALFSHSDKASAGNAEATEKPRRNKLQKKPPELRNKPAAGIPVATMENPRLLAVTARGNLRPELQRHPLENPGRTPLPYTEKPASRTRPSPQPATMNAETPAIPARNPLRDAPHADSQAFINPRPAPQPPVSNKVDDARAYLNPRPVPPVSNSVNDPNAFINPRVAPKPPGWTPPPPIPARSQLRDIQTAAAGEQNAELDALFDEVMRAVYSFHTDNMI